MTELLSRGIWSRLTALLDSVPVVMLEGPRASGKTAIGTMLQDAGRVAAVVDLSDSTVRRAAESAPTAFIDGLPRPVVIDEAQLVPELPLAVKRRVDRERTRGAFMLTGSSRLGRAQLGGSDPLAGRSARLRLWPMTQAELTGRPVNLVDDLIAATPGAPAISAAIDAGHLLARIRRGGLPTLASVAGEIDQAVRPQLMREYIEGVIFHEVGGRHDRAELLRLFQYLAASTGRLLNTSSVANEFGARRETIQTRLASLEAAFLLHLVPGDRPSEHRTLTAHPKVHAIDTGLACWAARVDDEPSAALWGSLVETFVVNELAAQAGWSTTETVVRHWRDTTRKVEVDAVLVRGDGLRVGIEIKAASDVRPDDLAGLRAFLAATGEHSRGIVFYTGGLVLPLDERIWAVPISALWDGLMPHA